MNWNNQITAVRKARRTNGNSVLEKIDNSRLNLAICLSFASLSSGTSQVKRNMFDVLSFVVGRGRKTAPELSQIAK